MNLALVTETGESFLTHAQLIRHIREKCGDSVADYVARFLGEDRKVADQDTLRRMRDQLYEIRRLLDNAGKEAEIMDTIIRETEVCGA